MEEDQSQGHHEIIEAKGGSTLNDFISTLIYRALEEHRPVTGRFNDREFTFEYHDTSEGIDAEIAKVKALFRDISPYTRKYGGL